MSDLWRALREDRTALVDPPWPRLVALFAENVSRRQRQDCDIGGRRLRGLADDARAELLAAARDYTGEYRIVPTANVSDGIVLAGHQPQMFHPGVWFKNFALGALAGRVGATGVNLIVDSDTVKVATLRVPGGSVNAPTVRAIEFDAAGPAIPYEERSILDRGRFEDFGRLAEAELSPLIAAPLLRQYWPLVVKQSRRRDNLGLAIAAGRHVLEGGLGWNTLELPQSRVCDLPAFGWFAAWLLLEAPRVRDVYNAAVGEYRRTHRVRSANHPAPDLDDGEAGVETPLWVWTAADPRRRRLFVRRSGRELRLADGAGGAWSLPVGEDAAPTAEAIARLRAGGVKLRTRALVTTLWARLALGDLFLHGIGGAKYDRVTDRIIERLFGLTPPGIGVLSATIQLPIDRPRHSAAELRRIDREMRELTYQPERWIEDAHPADAAGEPYATIAAKRRAIAATPTRETAKERCRGIRAASAALAPWVGARQTQLAQERGELARMLQVEAVLASREYAFCLYPLRSLCDFFLENGPAIP